MQSSVHWGRAAGVGDVVADLLQTGQGSRPPYISHTSALNIDEPRNSMWIGKF